MVEEVMELRKVKLDYFNSAWNVMDLVVILISVSNIIMALYTEIIVTDLLKVLQILNGKVPSGRMQEALTLKIFFCILAPSCWASNIWWFWHSELPHRDVHSFVGHQRVRVLVEIIQIHFLQPNHEPAQCNSGPVRPRCHGFSLHVHDCIWSLRPVRISPLWSQNVWLLQTVDLAVSCFQ